MWINQIISLVAVITEDVKGEMGGMKGAFRREDELMQFVIVFHI